MTVVNFNNISGINSITAQSNTLNFYDSAGKTLSIGASVSGNVVGNVTGNLTGNVNAGVVTASSSIVVGQSFIQNNAIGLGQTDNAGRNAGVGTATGTLVFNSTTNAVEVYNGNDWVDVRNTGTGIKATGGAITQAGGKTIHTFAGSGTFRISDPSLSSVDYLVVAGGGGASGRDVGGGGGAGGFRTGTGLPVSASPGSYTVTVGGGGNGGTDGGPAAASQKGQDSVFSTITSTGGGAGKVYDTAVPNDGAGGSGGGASGLDVISSGTNLTGGVGNSPPTSPPQGNPGGTPGLGPASPFYGGTGGGGAGQPGFNAQDGRHGGNGTASSISGTSVTYAGGGGGAGHRSTGNGTLGNGGLGGGGTAGTSPDRSTRDGTSNTGGGGGASRNAGLQGGSGGSGIVIIAYPS